MKYTIINRKGQFLENESFFNIGANNVISNVIWTEDPYEAVTIHPYQFNRGMPLFDSEVTNNLILLEELEGTENFCIVVNPCFDYYYQGNSDGTVSCWATPKNGEDPQDTTLASLFFESKKKPENEIDIEDNQEETLLIF